MPKTTDLCSVIHRQIKETEAFVTLVNVASNNMGSYIGLISITKVSKLEPSDRDLNIIQLQLFDKNEGGDLQNSMKSP